MKNTIPSSCVAITGASSGIGEAVAYKLAEAGKNLFLMGRRQDRLEQVKKKCLELGSPKVVLICFDIQNLSQPQIQKEIKDLILNEQLEVEVLINSAGLAKGVDLLQDAKPQDWDQMIDTNIKGLLQITHLLLPSIIRSRGYILNLGSVSGRWVYERGAVYCATKFAVRAISEGLRLDLKGTGVRITNIEPGMVNTEFSVRRLGSQQYADAVYADMMPLSANDIAETIFWCLQQPPHVNIQELVIYPTDQVSVNQVVRGENSVLYKNKQQST